MSIFTPYNSQPCIHYILVMVIIAFDDSAPIIVLHIVSK